MNPKMHIVKKCILYIFLITIAVVWFIPIFTLLATALKNKSDFFSLSLFQLPEVPAWSNFTNAITQGRLFNYMANDLFYLLLESSAWNFCSVHGGIRIDSAQYKTQHWYFYFFLNRYDAPYADCFGSH